MGRELRANGVDVRTHWRAEKIHVVGRRVRGVTAGGRFIKARTVVSNANLKLTISNGVRYQLFDLGQDPGEKNDLGDDKAALKAAPSLLEANYWMGQCYIKLRDPVKAKAEFKTIIDITPDSGLGIEAKKSLDSITSSR